MKINIDISREKCKSCGICVELCQFRVLTMISDNRLNGRLIPHVENIDECVGCGMCEMYCPDSAISVCRQSAEVGIV